MPSQRSGGPPGWTCLQERGRGARAADHDGHQQRQREQRPEQVARTSAHRHRRDQRADRGDAEVAERERREQAGQRLAQGGAEQEQPERRHRDQLQHEQVGEQRDRLGDQQRGAVHGREQEAVEAALVGVGDEQAVDAEHRGEQQGHPQDAGRLLAADACSGSGRSGRPRRW